MKDAHPDAGGDAGQARALNRAYEVLSDPARRAAYDASLPPEMKREPLSHAVAHRLGVSIGRYARRWSRGVREARRNISS